ncbi:FKBP-type peptidyl-prolyl cis-trans isomerase [Pedobacter sp. GSP4]|uniref:FKBP-type peptidyl-prolyl cis-trans isomerase n=1 Tax=Pedobacter sp. GSP4 TaxID=3453716 RepID=UPI003EED716D
MKIKYLYLFVILFLFSCSRVKQGEGNMTYQLVEDRAGTEMRDFCFFTATYKVENEQGKLLKSTGEFDSRPAFMYKNQPVFKGDLNSAVAHLSEGDSAIVKISVDSLKRYQGYQPAKGDKSKYLTYKIRINKVVARDGAKDEVFGNRIEQLRAAEIEHQGQLEPQKISRFMQEKKMDLQATPTGLLLPKNMDPTVKSHPGDTVKVNYIISSLDNQIFETNNEAIAKKAGIYHPKRSYAPLAVGIEKNPVSGFREAVMLIPKGSKATVIIPSKLAYGVSGTKAIPSYTPLICRFEIVQ